MNSQQIPDDFIHDYAICNACYCQTNINSTTIKRCNIRMLTNNGMNTEKMLEILLLLLETVIDIIHNNNN